tara:strand:- start:1564 stop:1863 length:300 start_codon:yes stop_codon:yes gene_type:complete
MSKETLNEKILNLRTAVISKILSKNKIKHSRSVLEKVANNRNDLSTYNYFLSKKNLKRKIVFLSLFFCLLIFISILAFFLARDIQLIDLWKYFLKYLDF